MPEIRGRRTGGDSPHDAPGQQIELRARFPDRPRSNGAAERLVAQVDDRLGKRRRNFRNARRLTTVVKEVAWRCAAGHVWRTKVSARITRLLRCRRCSTRRADETNSLAAIYPELLASWDDSGNHPLDPHAIKATYPRRVSWTCREGLSHPTYRASIAKRLKDAVPCPLCAGKCGQRGPRVIAAHRSSLAKLECEA